MTRVERVRLVGALDIGGASEAAWRDAEKLATPMFPPAYRPGNFLMLPPRTNYDPVKTDREALERITALADVFGDSGFQWMLVQLTPTLFDYLVTLGAEREDMEDEHDREPENYI